MRVIDKGWASLLISTGTVLMSLFFKIIPCQLIPNIPSSSAKWAFCSLNPDTISLFGIQQFFFGMTNSITSAYIITFIFTFVFVFTLLSVIFKKRKKSKED